MEQYTHYQSVKFFIKELNPLKHSLAEHETEYDPEKVATLIKAYKFTIYKIIEHGDEFLLKEKDDWEKLEEVQVIVNKFKKFLSSI